MRPLLLALLLLAAPAQAQDSASASTEALEAALGRATTRTPQDLGLQQSLERALADNLGLRAKLRELEAASFRAKAAIQPWLPILSASGTAHPFKTERFSDQFQAWQRSEGDDANYSVGLAAALPVGTSVNLGWSQGTFNQLLTWEPLDPDSLEAVDRVGWFGAQGRWAEAYAVIDATKSTLRNPLWQRVVEVSRTRGDMHIVLDALAQLPCGDMNAPGLRALQATMRHVAGPAWREWHP